MIIETSNLSLLCFAINYCATISVREAENTAGKGSGKGGSNTAGKGPGKGGSRSQEMTGDKTLTGTRNSPKALTKKKTNFRMCTKKSFL